MGGAEVSGAGAKVLLDTHALLWLTAEHPRLGRKARQVALAALAEQRLCVSVVSFWEMASLMLRGRLESSLDAASARAEILGTGIQELALTGPAAVLSASLDVHPDPADRFISATAVVHDALLITADERLLAWRHPLKRHDARR
jgi:PIN domain nuclease of toxin-antitoxin system